MDDIHYREYKILLRPERFFHPSQFEAYWKKICAVAPDVKVGVATNRDAFKRHVREVLFYDTPDYELYRNSFILRKRTYYVDGWPEDTHELVLKYRHADLATAADVDVTPHLQGSAAIKFKEELLPLRDQIGGMRSLYSHNCVLMSPGLTLDAGLSRISTVFPVIRRFCNHDDADVKLVNNMPVEEVLVDAGTLDFGHGLDAKANIAVWRDRATETSLVGEFAFQLKFESYDKLNQKANARAEEFFKAIQTHAPEWVQIGTTKTSIVYNYGSGQAVGHE